MLYTARISGKERNGVFCAFAFLFQTLPCKRKHLPFTRLYQNNHEPHIGSFYYTNRLFLKHCKI